MVNDALHEALKANDTGSGRASLFRRGATGLEQTVHRVARNQTDPALEGEILVGPEHHHGQTVAKTHQIQDVHEQPREPREGAGEFSTGYDSDGLVSADRGEVTFVHIPEGFPRQPLEFARNILARQCAHLVCRWSHRWHGATVFGGG